MIVGVISSVPGTLMLNTPDRVETIVLRIFLIAASLVIFERISFIVITT